MAFCPDGKREFMKFTIVVVCYNAGEKLKETVTSILDQSMTDYEVVIKDGMSTDGSVEALEAMAEVRDAKERVKIIREKDQGIYDAMNAAIRHASGEYYLFLNCGDLFYDENVLQRFSDAISEAAVQFPEEKESLHVFYGNRYLIPTKSVEYIAPRMTPLTCFRNIPCHQCCFYSSDCFAERGYRTDLKVRADYEHFLWLFFAKKASFHYVNACVAKYEGGGYSENPESVKRSAEEHRAITKQYLSKWQLFYCNAYMIVTLQPLRHFLATNPFLSKGYNALIHGLYRIVKK